MKTVTSLPPFILQAFDRKLLSHPIWRFNVEELKKIADWLLEKIQSNQFKKFPNTIVNLRKKHQEFMELYERAKKKEDEVKEEKGNKTQLPFYRLRHSNRDDQRLFEKLERKFSTYSYDRKKYAISKIR